MSRHQCDVGWSDLLIISVEGKVPERADETSSATRCRLSALH